MTGIVLSASVRQNLLSLQSTSQLLATTQNDLATGNKVNSALDNPTNYFTAQSLNSRASDISSLLDSVGNGVQVLQAANTGITSLKSLLDSAKSIANQALQASSGYSTKSQFSATVAGATANNLLGTGSAATAGTVTAGAFSNIDVSNAGTSATAATIAEANNSFTGPVNVAGTSAVTTAGGAFGTSGTLDLSSGSVTFNIALDGEASPHAITINASSTTDGTTAFGSASAVTQTEFMDALNYQINQAENTTGKVYASDNGSGGIQFSSQTAGSSSSVAITGYSDTSNGGNANLFSSATASASGTSANNLQFDVAVDGNTAQPITIDQDAVNAYNTANSTTLDASNLTGSDIANLINAQLTGATASYSSANGALSFTSGSTGTGSKLTISATGVNGTTTNTTGIANHAEADGTAAGTAASEDFTLTVDGVDHAIDISKAAVDTYNGAHTGATIDASNLGASDVAKLINSQIGGGSTVASVVGGALTFTSGTTGSASSIALSAVTTAGGATGSTGVALTTTTSGTDADTGLSGLELTIGATAGGTATDITFGTGAGQISTLNDLNTALAANNLMATVDTHGQITISTTNNNASATIGDVGGSATDTGKAFASSAGTQTGAVADASSQETRAGLVSQFNQILDQIKTTAQDSSFNGVNLLNGDLLQLTFNETGTSTLNIQGNTDDPAGLGLSDLISGTDFLDNAGTNKIISAINSASNTLDSQASTLGSNLSIVQIRQTFSNSMINVLQTGASNLTLADPNELAADSQALSTRQSIAVSALALANQSQQSVLQLLQG